jgi:hypothetical protein
MEAIELHKQLKRVGFFHANNPHFHLRFLRHGREY